MADRFADWRNVKDYGAVGNGSTNDLTAIQNALNAGGKIFFPNGTYKVNGTLTLIADTEIDLGGSTISLLSL